MLTYNDNMMIDCKLRLEYEDSATNINYYTLVEVENGRDLASSESIDKLSLLDIYDDSIIPGFYVNINLTDKVSFKVYLKPRNDNLHLALSIFRIGFRIMYIKKANLFIFRFVSIMKDYQLNAFIYELTHKIKHILNDRLDTLTIRDGKYYNYSEFHPLPIEVIDKEQISPSKKISNTKRELSTNLNAVEFNDVKALIKSHLTNSKKINDSLIKLLNSNKFYTKKKRSKK